ncbi:MAG: MFS transporter [Candidatus Nanopelagicales bacterium]
MTDAARIPRSAWTVALSAATLGVIYGYDGSNVAGAQLYFQDFFGLNNDDSSVETIVTATVYGELIGVLLAGFIINRFGRKPTIVAVASRALLHSPPSCSASRACSWASPSASRSSPCRSSWPNPSPPESAAPHSLRTRWRRSWG